MILLEESIFNLIIAAYTIFTNIIFAIACRKRRDLLIWLVGICFFSIGAVFIYLQIFSSLNRFIGNIFYLISTTIFIIIGIHEYFQTFLKNKEFNDSLNNFIKYAAIFLIPLSLALIVIQTVLFIFLCLTLYMLLKIYLTKRNITRLFMCFTIATGLITLTLTMLENFKLEAVWEFSFVANIITISFLLTTGLAAPIEDRITKSEAKYFDAYNQTEFYEDLFAHDISNILQYVKSSLDLIKIYQEDPQGKNKINKVISILNEQTIRGSNLVKNIRALSELTETQISLKSMNLLKILNLSIDYNKKNYPDRDIYISTIPSKGNFYVKANDLFLNVIENLFINAIKYNTNPKIEIEVEISPVKKNGINYVKIEFKDNGIGVSNQIKNSLFKSIVRKNGKTEGRGLSLSLVKKILDSYNAEIWVEDRIIGDPSKGSNFIMLIPEVS